MKKYMEMFWSWKKCGQKGSRKPREAHLKVLKLCWSNCEVFANVSELQCTVVIITALQKPLYLQLPDATGKGRDELELEIEEKRGGEPWIR